MRILFVLPYVPSLIRVRPYNFIRQLARRHEVAVLATGSGREVADGDGLRAICRGVYMVPLSRAASLRSCALAAARGEPLQSAVCQSPALEGRLLELLAERRFDVVHVEHLRAARLGTLVPDDVPTVFDSVDCISLLLERTLRASHSLRQRMVAALELRRTRAYEARLLGQFDRVVVTSPQDAQALRALAPRSEVAVVPNGVDLDYFRPSGAPPDPATLVFSGKMSYHANVTAALHFVRRIFPLVRAARPDARLRIVGSDPPRAIRALGSDPAISVTGYVPDLREALGRAAVAVCPVTVKVGIQNKVLEAMAMGVPVVSTREGVEGLETEPGRDLLVADNPAGFAEHVCRLLADPGLRDRLGSAGRRYVEARHRWDVAAGRLEDLYSEAISSRRRARSHERSVEEC